MDMGVAAEGVREAGVFEEEESRRPCEAGIEGLREGPARPAPEVEESKLSEGRA